MEVFVMAQNFFGEESSRSEIVGKNLKCLLKARKISQERFSELVEKDPKTVYRWCNYGIDSIDQIFEIARLLRVSPWGIIYGESDDAPHHFTIRAHLFGALRNDAFLCAHILFSRKTITA